MGPLIPDEIEKYLDRRLSHLISPLNHPDLARRIKEHLIGLGVDIAHESIISDEDGMRWLVFSVREESARPLVMDLIENGFPPNIKGIDARPSQEGRSAALPNRRPL